MLSIDYSYNLEMVLLIKRVLLFHDTLIIDVFSPQSRSGASETVSITAVGGIAASILVSILSRESVASIVVSVNTLHQSLRKLEHITEENRAKEII